MFIPEIFFQAENYSDVFPCLLMGNLLMTLYLNVCSNNGTQKYLSEISKGFHILFSHDSTLCPIFTWHNWDLEQLKGEPICLESFSPHQTLAWDSETQSAGSLLPDAEKGLWASLWSIYELWLYWLSFIDFWYSVLLLICMTALS